MVSSYDNSQLCDICFIRIFLEQTAWIRMDATNLLGCSIVLQLHRFATNSIYHDRRIAAAEDMQAELLNICHIIVGGNVRVWIHIPLNS